MFINLFIDNQKDNVQDVLAKIQLNNSVSEPTINNSHKDRPDIVVTSCYYRFCGNMWEDLNVEIRMEADVPLPIKNQILCNNKVNNDLYVVSDKETWLKLTRNACLNTVQPALLKVLDYEAISYATDGDEKISGKEAIKNKGLRSRTTRTKAHFEFIRKNSQILQWVDVAVDMAYTLKPRHIVPVYSFAKRVRILLCKEDADWMRETKKYLGNHDINALHLHLLKLVMNPYCYWQRAWSALELSVAQDIIYQEVSCGDEKPSDIIQGSELQTLLEVFGKQFSEDPGNKNTCDDLAFMLLPFKLARAIRQPHDECLSILRRRDFYRRKKNDVIECISLIIDGNTPVDKAGDLEKILTDNWKCPLWAANMKDNKPKTLPDKWKRHGKWAAEFRIETGRYKGNEFYCWFQSRYLARPPAGSVINNGQLEMEATVVEVTLTECEVKQKADLDYMCEIQLTAVGAPHCDYLATAGLRCTQHTKNQQLYVILCNGSDFLVGKGKNGCYNLVTPIFFINTRPNMNLIEKVKIQ